MSGFFHADRFSPLRRRVAADMDFKSKPLGQNWPNLKPALTFCLISGRKRFPQLAREFPHLWRYSFFGLISGKTETRTNPFFFVRVGHELLDSFVRKRLSTAHGGMPPVLATLPVRGRFPHFKCENPDISDAVKKETLSPVDGFLIHQPGGGSIRTFRTP